MERTPEATIIALKTELIDVKEKLAASKASFLNIVGKSRDGILIVNEDGIIVYANPAALDLFNKGLGDLLGENIGLPIGGTRTTELTIPHKVRGLTTVEINVADTSWNDQPAKLATLRDVTERKRTAEILEHLSRHDYLTDLPNRVYFEETLNKSVAKAKRNKTNMSVMYLDMDNFKQVNDTLGHDVGDKLLQYVVKLLSKTIRRSDTLARLGGDEFAIILDDIKSPLNAAEVAQKILDIKKTPFTYENEVIPLLFSIGIAIFPISGDTPQDLTKHADIAMYAAKKSGKHQYQFFTDSLNEESKRLNKLQNNLNSALENDEFYLQYQPIISAKNLEVYGIETLLRWKSPKLGDVPVTEFLPIIEGTRQILAIGEWILKKACSEYQQQPMHNIKLAINFSHNQLLDDKIVDKVFAILDKYQIDTSNVIIELTESVIMQHPENTIKKLERLANANISLAIDDFGTGYSSFSYLKRLPVKILKIDRSFVKDIGIDENDTIIVKSIINLAKSLGLQTIAEGVETKEQLEFLRANQCDMLQGYYFTKPENFNDILNNWIDKESSHD